MRIDSHEWTFTEHQSKRKQKFNFQSDFSFQIFAFVDGKHHVWWKTYDCMSHFFFNNISILQQNKKCNRWSDGKYDLIKTSFSIIQPSFCENILPTKCEFSLADWKTTSLKTTLKIICFRKIGEKNVRRQFKNHSFCSVFIFLLMMKQKVVDLPKVTDAFVLIPETVADEEY